MNQEEIKKAIQNEECGCNEEFNESPFCCGESQDSNYTCGPSDVTNEEIPEPISRLVDMLFNPGSIGVIQTPGMSQEKMGDLIEKGKTWKRYRAYKEITNTLKEIIVEDKSVDNIQFGVEKMFLLVAQ